ncbi:uncharacterized protein DSM5745_10690 [Aspergillus mulundensis]|uniref:Uncharacterized protein n=1 Tax=Aspergillus mulundensis TaxID=1810919 RepID=A0A3D8QH91_9EURO|nr:Uncharacterized protein DSM5745_10690 [Aspergillus mulundensis]RDW61192.1 Uncharacterized protein DSM5745_10690 [Aspergillus mulundensis]
MPPKPSPQGRKDGTIHFINARPASETERLDIKRMVRAHVGKWLSTQTKDRAGSAVEAAYPPPPPAATSADPNADAAVEIDPPSTDASSSPSPPSSVSSPECNCSANPAQPICIPPQTTEPTLSIVPRTIIPATNAHTCREQCDGQEGCRCGLPGVDGPNPLYPGEYIEAIGAGCLDPFRVYTTKYEPELIRASEEYCLSCLWPGLTPGPSIANMKSWFPMSLSDQTLFTAFLFGALSHMRVQALHGWIPRQMFHARKQRMLETVEMETIKLVSREIDNPSRAVCDSVIWSVVCMAHNKADDDLAESPPPPFTAPMQRLQWLGVYGSLRPNLVHIGGLIQMINLRGGIDKIQLPGLASVISFSDVVTSTTVLGSPVFPFVPLEPSRRGKTMQDLLEYTDSEVDQYHAQFQQLGLPRIFAEIICAMNTYIALVDKYVKGEKGYDTCLVADQRNLIHYNLISVPRAALPGQDSICTQPEDIIYESFRLATLIYSVGVILPLPAQSSPLVNVAELLYNTLLPAISAHTTLRLWDTPNGQAVLLWILMLGGIAATQTPHRAWFIATLSSVAEINRVASYNHLKQYLARVAWYSMACDKPGMELWGAVEDYRRKATWQTELVYQRQSG